MQPDMVAIGAAAMLCFVGKHRSRLEKSIGGWLRLRSSSRGPQLRLKKRVAIVAEEERRELPFDSNRKQLFSDEEGAVACSRARWGFAIV
ncbi:hypothetical protein GW17_00046601 [Ensete ventricosum]|nr:hypothetical protein GW17_00046601 [Ensete ventricosum]